MSMSLIKIYQTPTTTNEWLPTEQQNGYHGVATEQFIEGDGACVYYSYWLAIFSNDLQIFWSVCAIMRGSIGVPNYIMRGPEGSQILL